MQKNISFSNSRTFLEKLSFVAISTPPSQSRMRRKLKTKQFDAKKEIENCNKMRKNNQLSFFVVDEEELEIATCESSIHLVT